MLTIRAGSKHLIREINQAIVLDLVRRHGALSRTEIAARSHLSLPTVSGITSELIDAGLLYEQATGVSTGGRRPVMIAFNAQAGYAVGIKLKEDAAVAVLTDLDAHVVAHHLAPIRKQAPEAIVAELANVVKTLAPAAGAHPVVGVGIGMASVIDRRRDVVRYATYFGWQDLPLAQMLGEQLDMPVVLDNDVNALAVAEQWFGAGRGVADFVVISLGRGVGLGMILNGRLYRGTGGGAGEFGHIVMQPDGPICACGKRGCLEAFVSDPALVRQVSAALGRDATIDEAVRLAAQGDVAVSPIFHRAAEFLGIAVANLVNVLNPALVIIGGEGARAGNIILEPFRATLEKHTLGPLVKDVMVAIEPWGDDAWARGAASLLLSELFQPALHRGDEDRPSFNVLNMV